jgi:hypothetical protein
MNGFHLKIMVLGSLVCCAIALSHDNDAAGFAWMISAIGYCIADYYRDKHK